MRNCAPSPHFSSYTLDRNYFGPLMTLRQEPLIPLSKQTVADQLGISVRSVENWINEGILPAPVKLGNRVYWHPDVFYGWLSNRLKEGSAECHKVIPEAPATKPRKRGAGAVAVELRASTERKLARLQATH